MAKIEGCNPASWVQRRIGAAMAVMSSLALIQGFGFIELF